LAIDDEEARKRRAAELHRAIEEARGGKQPPSSPREFTDREAREAAEEAGREKPDGRDEGDAGEEERE
jgi:hypothetical protein